MPYTYKKQDNKYCVYKKDSGEKIGCTDATKTALKKYLAALHINEKIKGVDGKACWDGYRYAGTENGKDKCIKVETIEEGEMCEQCAADLLRDIQSGLYNDVIVEAEYQGRKVTLNKPIRTPKSEPKKFKVYVKDPKTGNVKMVRFGHQGGGSNPDSKTMSIKKSDPERRKSFRARHNCADKKDKTTAGYWSCKMW
jgi:hypothetical protein